MTDYLIYVHRIENDSTLTEIHCIGLVENEQKRPESPPIFNILSKFENGLEDTGKFVILPRKGGVLRLAGEACITVAGWE
jgi:hypothetical protein